MLNEEGENITLSDNLAMFSKWANRWKDEEPYKFTKAIHNYAATNLLPRHLGPEYVIHGAKLYSPWDPTRTEITLVVSEWFFDRSLSLIKNLDEMDHPFSKVIVMIPPSVSNSHDYSRYSMVPVHLQYRDSPDFMDLCAAEITTDWFMITNSYHQVSRHVDLMFTVSPLGGRMRADALVSSSGIRPCPSRPLLIIYLFPSRKSPASSSLSYHSPPRRIRSASSTPTARR
jgi:hypothetical protein